MDKLEFSELKPTEEVTKEKKYLEELPAGLLSIIFAGISVLFLLVYFNVVKADKSTNTYTVFHTLGIICLIVSVGLLILQIVFPIRLFIRFQKVRQTRSYAISGLCIMSAVVIVIMIILGTIFIM